MDYYNKKIITDINVAPRNQNGRVEFRSDFYLIKPKDIERGNGTILYEVSNRGGKGMLGYFNNAAGSRAPQTAEEMGDGFLLRNGFSLLWLGWQFDVPLQGGRMRVYTPIATDGGIITSGRRPPETPSPTRDRLPSTSRRVETRFDAQS